MIEDQLAEFCDQTSDQEILDRLIKQRLLDAFDTLDSNQKEQLVSTAEELAFSCSSSPLEVFLLKLSKQTGINQSKMLEDELNRE